nr:MAG TPA: hypothetical protein [Caudoviricetes sp.]
MRKKGDLSRFHFAAAAESMQLEIKYKQTRFGGFFYV